MQQLAFVQEITRVLLVSSLMLVACGDDETQKASAPVQGERVALLEGAARVFVGYQSTCARAASGTYCWGLNNKRQLGVGAHRAASSRAIRVEGLPGELEHVSGSLFTMCGLIDSGDVYCWGEDRDGSLGPGEPNLEVVEGANMFSDGAFAISPHRPFQGAHLSVSFAGAHGCALTTDHELRCWGRYTDAAILGDEGLGEEVIDIDAPGFEPVVHVTTESTDCALDSKGEIWCWGRGAFGALGRAYDAADEKLVSCSNDLPASALRFCAKQPYKVAGLPAKAVALDGGGRGGFCALLSTGRVSCWGDNTGNRFVADDVLGVESPTLIDLPVEVSRIAVGEDHVCALGVTGQVFCAGDTTSGQTGPIEASPGEFVEVPLPMLAVDLSAGFRSTCAVLEGGQIACWGLNDSSQLGTRRAVSDGVGGAPDVRASPVLVELEVAP